MTKSSWPSPSRSPGTAVAMPKPRSSALPLGVSADVALVRGLAPTRVLQMKVAFGQLAGCTTSRKASVVPQAALPGTVQSATTQVEDPGASVTLPVAPGHQPRLSVKV